MTMKCVACGKAKMVRDTRNLTYTYKGETTVIKAVAGLYCLSCNESVHESDESQRLSESMLKFNKEVNSSIVNPLFISNIRKKLKLDQQEAAEIFGGGPNAFSRYETGKTKPPLALVQLLKLLENHPDLLNEIRPRRQKRAAKTTKGRRLAKH
jgi:HTH-type transcriptional regulator / antitoxin MqsA